mmetsp:Transcript_16302/g.25384  ORF Transcript_16302/g.25384 Transcript_16302/m.25384 type:complete len:99 (-) Transcript_16302:3886-4182(-)
MAQMFGEIRWLCSGIGIGRAQGKRNVIGERLENPPFAGSTITTQDLYIYLIGMELRYTPQSAGGHSRETFPRWQLILLPDKLLHRIVPSSSNTTVSMG